jgi:uncharacterized protein YqgQ
MKKRLFLKALGKVGKEYGDKWARQAGDRTVDFLTRKAKDRGLLQKTYNLDSLRSELQQMYAEGRISRTEWEEAKERMRKAWKNRQQKKQ